MRVLAGIALLAVCLPGCGSREASARIDAEGLAGTWVARLRHNGQESRIALRFERRGDGALSLTAAIPAIEAWSVPLGEARVQDDGSRVLTGLGELVWNAERGTLEADEMKALVPVHSIPVVLERSAPLERAGHAQIAAPLAEPVWTFDAGAALWSGCAFAADTVFVGSDAGEVLAIDAASGAARWRASTAGPVRARPTVTGETVLVHSDDGWLYALERRSGAERWKTRLRAGAFERVPPNAEGSRYDHFASSATVAADTVFVGSGDGQLHALDAASGAVRWSYRAQDTIASTPAVEAGRVFVGSFDGKIRALDVASGKLVWEYDTGAPVPSSPTVAHGLVLIGSRSYDLWALDAADGTAAWKYYFWFSWIDSEVNVVHDTAYVGSSDARSVFALDAATGRLRWSADVGGWAWARPAVSDTLVFAATVGVTGYIGERHGRFVALDRSDGTPRWRYEAEAVEDGMWGFPGSPAIGAGRVFVGGLDGRLRAFVQ